MAIAGVHLALFALLLAGRTASEPDIAQPAMLMASVASPTPSVAPPEPVLEPIEAVVEPPVVEVAADVAAPAVAAPSVGDAVCDIDGLVRAAFSADGSARAALARVPRRARSVANALQLWDGGWTLPPARGGASIRSAIAGAVASAPQTCREQPIAGPRMIAVADRGGTTMLVLGSGRWAWQDIIATSE